MDDNQRTKEELIDELGALRLRVTELEAGSWPSSLEDTLSTVAAPEQFEPAFLKAQEFVARYFRDKVEDPRHATITISGERYILVRAASMSVEFFDMVTSLYTGSGPEEARTVASNLLFDVAHSIGKADAQAFHAWMGVSDPIARVAAGPVHFSFSGWAFVKILPESSPTPDDDYYLLYDHPFSFESNAWVSRGRTSDFPVCIMNSGYSSGWCEESFGRALVAAEIQCLAKGDPQCRFIMAPPSRIEEHLARHRETYRRAAGAEIAVPEYFQRKRLEEALRASHAELEHRVRVRTEELARANEALHAEIAERKREEEERRLLERQVQHAQKLESLGVLAGGIAHDFNNLLVGIIGNAGLALMKLEADDPLRRTIEGIQAAGTRAADLTKQMLAYSGRGKFVIQPVSLTEVVEEMSGLLGASISKRADYDLDLAPDVPRIEADATQIRQVVMNLITNASEALGDDDGHVTLRTGAMHADRALFASAHLDDDLPEGRYAFVEVSDTGCGMDDDTRAKIFDPFFTTKFMGRGLGLAAVLGIVRGHRGTIKVTSEPGKGTTVLVLFPVWDGPPARPETVVAAGSSPDAEAWRGSGTILVVDDEALVRETASALLAELGFDVVTARDGREGVELFRERGDGVAAVLLDLTMPHMGGEEALAEMRRIRPDVRVVLMSGYSEQEVMTRFSERGLAGFLQKPFKATAFGQTLRRAITPG